VCVPLPNEEKPSVNVPNQVGYFFRLHWLNFHWNTFCVVFSSGKIMPSREGRLNLKATGLTDVEVCLNFIDMFRIYFFFK
jgi:hypothetical protein